MPDEIRAAYEVFLQVKIRPINFELGIYKLSLIKLSVFLHSNDT